MVFACINHHKDNKDVLDKKTLFKEENNDETNVFYAQSLAQAINL